MIINLSITVERTERSKRYRFDTAKAGTIKGLADLTDFDCQTRLNKCVGQLYPIPYAQHSRDQTLALLAEMERRGLVQPNMAFVISHAENVTPIRPRVNA